MNNDESFYAVSESGVAGMPAAGMIIDDPGGVVYLVNLSRSALD